MLKNRFTKTFYCILVASFLFQASCSSEGEDEQDKSKKEATEKDETTRKKRDIDVESIVCDTIEDHTFHDMKKEAERLPKGSLSEAYLYKITKLSAKWDTLMLSEESKREKMERLLDEVSYNPAHDEVEIKRYRKLICLLRNEIYTPKSLANLEKIDEYDALQDSVISETFSFVKGTKDIEKYPLTDELMEEISHANSDSLLMLRAHYGEELENYNQFIKEHKEELEKEGIEAEPLPTWYGDDDEYPL